jgi:hypothetical protein
MKVWARTRSNGEYHSENIAHAVFGFRELGAEIIKYETIDEIYDWVTRDDIVIDYIDQSNQIFSKFGAVAKCENYPEVMQEFLGRKIWYDTINHINNDQTTWGNFVKPVKDKVFTGKVINSLRDLIGCGSCYEDYEVICSEPVKFLREWRGFITYDKLIDLRPYKGDYHYSYDAKTVDRIMETFTKWEDRPFGCSIDIGVDDKGRTLLVEVNDGYALGNYGLYSIYYAKLISARWSQVLDRKDEYQF